VKRLTVALLLIFSIMVPVAYAQEGPTQDEINAVARQLFCPVCENTPLDVCPTEACEQWRDVIRTRLMEGQSEEEILDYFAVMYGDSVLAQPPARQVFAWLMPVVIVLAAFVALAFWLRSSTHPQLVTVTTEVMEERPYEMDLYIERIEKELAEWE
jgi:cytochrome c-type biogenesis protein CcmH